MSQLAYWIETPAVNAAQSAVHSLVNAILDFQKLKILTSGPVRRPNVHHHTKFREDHKPILVEIALFERGGHFERKFQGERGVPHQRFLAPEK